MWGAKSKEFVIKQMFKSVKEIGHSRKKTEIHYNVPWIIKCARFFPLESCYPRLTCSEPQRADDEWSIKTKIWMRLGGQYHGQCQHHVFSKLDDTVEFRIPEIETRKKVEFRVSILEMTGIKGVKLRDFDDESAKKFSDIVLKVKDQKFHVNKTYLASHSTYFESLLLGNFQNSRKSEILLEDIDPNDLQHFLDLIYGESLVEDWTVVGILQLAEFFGAKTVFHRCEEFLLEKSKLKLKDKDCMAQQYNLGKLKEKCWLEMNTADNVVPDESLHFRV